MKIHTIEFKLSLLHMRNGFPSSQVNFITKFVTPGKFIKILYRLQNLTELRKPSEMSLTRHLRGIVGPTDVRIHSQVVRRLRLSAYKSRTQFLPNLFN